MISSIRVLLLFILSLFIFSGCSDKPITLGDIAGIGDDFAEILEKMILRIMGLAKVLLS